MDKNVKPLCLILLLVISMFSTAFAMEVKEVTDVDKLFRDIDLQKMTQTDHALNLLAQTSRYQITTQNVNEFTDFVVVGANNPVSHYDTRAEFDKNQNILKQKTYLSPFIGVFPYTQSEIPTITLQEGYERLQSCLITKKIYLPKDMANVVIYKISNNLGGYMVYDYRLEDASYPTEYCQEALYVPAQKSSRDIDIPEDCELGMIVSCHYDIAVP